MGTSGARVPAAVCRLLSRARPKCPERHWNGLRHRSPPHRLFHKAPGKRPPRRRLVPRQSCGKIGIGGGRAAPGQHWGRAARPSRLRGLPPIHSRARTGLELKRLGIPKLITLLAALLMVVSGIILSHFTGGRDAVAAPRIAPPAAGVPATQAPESPIAAPAAGPRPAGEQKAPGAEAAEPATTSPKPAAPAPAPVPPGVRAPRKPAPLSRATSRLPLPPLSPADFGPVQAGGAAPATGPAPNVLWLSGVIQGDPRVALLRRGEHRYVMQEGGTFESYRVLKITSNSVTLQRGTKKQTLRVGQH
jgi:hypothetical protein